MQTPGGNVRRFVKRFSIASAAALLGSSFGWASAAHAATVVACGQTITKSITVANDIGPCPDDGLLVTGKGIIVNLAGHTVTGAASDPASTVDQAGIHLEGASGAVVTGGTVRGFFVGVLVRGGASNTITKMTVADNVGLGTTLYNNGIALDGSNYNKVTFNTVKGNGPAAGINMINSASHNYILRNLVTDNHAPSIGLGPGGADQQFDEGINIDSAASDNLIADNQVLRNGHFGINLGGFPAGSRNKAIHNTVKNNGNSGINAGGNGHTVSGNVIDHNGYEQFLPVGGVREQGGINGVDTCGAPGARACGPDPTTIQDNTITNNAGYGVDLGFNGNQATGGCGDFGCHPPTPFAPPRSNLVQRNIVRNNGRDGIFVECDQLFDASFNATCLTSSPPHQGQRILRNITSGNGGASAGTLFWDLHDENPNCDHDIWLGNTFQTANPPCTTR